ncbi:MAG: short-chain dehydrogenase [Gammaproteobacteria bacterium]|nr:short-chain dehydrogenase [Gammaproteobacteria bacterium]OUU10293.1 MAG: short-chain dehydrogenase [Gammaproteobacteria bacterium TMED34]
MSDTTTDLILITGASKGIGRAAAERFRRSGIPVINISRSPCTVDGVENHALDLTLPDAEQTLRSVLGERVEGGQISIIHNAAMMTKDTADATETASFLEVLTLNVVAPHIINQALLPLMQPGSSVIYIGSTLSEKAVANTYSYVTSKHATVGMMRATCQDLAGREIHTCCVCPGFTDTQMLREHVGNDEEVLKAIAGLSTFGRLITPDEIAGTIAYAVDNPVVNGSVINANLGQVES